MANLLRSHRDQHLRPISDAQRLIILRKHVWEDALHCFKTLDPSKPIKINFLGDPAVDHGGPLREFSISL